MRTPSMRRFVVTAAFSAGALGVGVAVAAWTANGTGDTQARSLSAQELTVSARSGTADLYPGFVNGDVFFSVNNTNPYPVTFTSASFGTVTSSDLVNCPSSNVTVDATASGLSLSVPANGSADLSIADVVTMIAAAPDGCQNKSFLIAATLSGAQQ